jgi:hypothetical protein
VQFFGRDCTVTIVLIGKIGELIALTVASQSRNSIRHEQIAKNQLFVDSPVSVELYSDASGSVKNPPSKRVHPPVTRLLLLLTNYSSLSIVAVTR